MLDIVQSCNPVEYRKNAMTQTQENGKNSSYHPIQFPGKLMNQTWENGEKPNFGQSFGPFGQSILLIWILIPLEARHCPKLSSYVIQKKINEPNLRKS